MDASLLLLLIVAVPASAAAVQLLLARHVGRGGAGVMAVAAVAAFAAAATLVHSGATASVSATWMPSLGVELALRGDRFGLFFAMLVSGVGALVATYASAYLDPLPPARLGRFYATLTAFMTAMLGVALADDLLTLVLFWEATSVASWMLIGFWYEDDHARRGANTALQVTALGGLVMLAGFLLLGHGAGTFSLHALTTDAGVQATLARSGLADLSLLLILVGALTKSAQFPFHFWLPGAMVAPTPVSTYLHAATMVKAGIFLLGRLGPLYGESTLWAPILGTLGLITFVLGAWQAFRQTDLKALLARTTVSALGMMTMGYGFGLAAQDSLQILAHASYKGALFLCAGIIEHAAGTRDLRELGGLRRDLPVTFVAATIGVLGLCGLPPTLAFLAKEGLYGALLETEALAGGLRAPVLVAVVAANALLAAAGLRFLVGAFLGGKRAVSGHRAHEEHESHGEGVALWGPPVALGAVSVGLFALALTPMTETLLGSLSSAGPGGLHASLREIHAGPLALSAVTVLAGVALFLARVPLLARIPAQGFGPAAGILWEAGMARVVVLATTFASHWQSGRLHWYFSAMLLFIAALPLLSLGTSGVGPADSTVSLDTASGVGLLLCLTAAVASIAVAIAPTRLAAAISLSAVGLLVASLYVVYRSPDIVLTQILIEAASTIFLLLVLFLMPPFRREPVAAGKQAWNLMVSVLVGVAVFVPLLLAGSPSLRSPRSISLDYLSRSFGEAGGANAVNLIIVDFRAIDTTGEIAVLVIVALCVWGVLRARRSAPA